MVIPVHVRILALLCLLTPLLQAQSVSPTPATVPAGNGAPTAQTPAVPCTGGMAGPTSATQYVDTSIATGNRYWTCFQDPTLLTYAWHQPFSSPVLAVATTSTITGGTFALGGCTTPTTVTISGATTGVNGVSGAYLWASPPTQTIIGGFDPVPRVWISAANTVSVMACAQGILSSVPNFQVKVFEY